MSIIYNMSRSRTIGTVIASLIIGVLTFFIAAPKKAIKKRQNNSSEESKKSKEDMFI
ncbi:MAG: hypothetical protein AB8B73_04155 [Ekhidna sp.]